jgi:hypothetical protein
VKRTFVWAVILLMGVGCSRLPTLTPATLAQAEEQWSTHRPAVYDLVVEMSGDRVEKGRFDVEVRSDHVINLRRNGLVIRPNPGEDYSMEGLFRMLKQELGLAEQPAMLGAPPGYSIYLTARFDETNGRLIRYRRIVGGTSNAIEVNVLEYRETRQ